MAVRAVYTNSVSDKYILVDQYENDRELRHGDDGRRDLKLAVRYYKQTEFDAFIEQGYALPEPTEHYFLLSFETGFVDGAPVCNVTRTKYSLPAQDDAAVIIDNGIEEEASSDEVTIIE